MAAKEKGKGSKTQENILMKNSGESEGQERTSGK